MARRLQVGFYTIMLLLSSGLGGTGYRLMADNKSLLISPWLTISALM